MLPVALWGGIYAFKKLCLYLLKSSSAVCNQLPLRPVTPGSEGAGQILGKVVCDAYITSRIGSGVAAWVHSQYSRPLAVLTRSDQMT